jgi:hypothetical protein
MTGMRDWTIIMGFMVLFTAIFSVLTKTRTNEIFTVIAAYVLLTMITSRGTPIWLTDT